MVQAGHPVQDDEDRRHHQPECQGYRKWQIEQVGGKRQHLLVVAAMRVQTQKRVLRPEFAD